MRLINGRAYRKHEEKQEGTPVLRIQNLNGGDRWFYSDMDLPQNKYCEEGDLLFAWSATFGPYIYSGPRAIYHYHIWKVEPFEGIMNREFAYFLLSALSDAVKQGGRGISMKHATKSGMEQRLIPSPRPALQAEFCCRIRRLWALSTYLDQGIKRQENLFSSLQHRAFQGCL
jgi:type I restriction enzyme S subunit